MTTKKKILIVDDEPNITWSIQKYLSKEGYFIATADSAKKGAEILNTTEFDLILTDMKMPEVDGFQFLHWIKKHQPKAKVVMMTAFGSPSARDAAKQIGAYRYFEKPVDLNQLKKFINETLSEKGFTGNILDIYLFDFVQMILLSRKQKLISLTDPISMQMGFLYLKNGEVIHAECGGLHGEEAFYTIMAMKTGIFSDMPWIEPPSRTINAPFNHLLMEAARIMDESEANIKDLEATVEAVKKIMESHQNSSFQDHTTKKTELLKQNLNSLKEEIPELLCVIIIDGRDGRLLEGISIRENYSLNDSSVLFKRAFSSFADAEVMLTNMAESRKDLDEILVSNKENYSLLKRINGGDFLFYLSFPKTLNLGLVKIISGKYAEELGKSLL